MNNVNKTLKMKKFNKLMVMWVQPTKKLICVRCKLTGYTKIITIGE